jgi:hypothetical protein
MSITKKTTESRTQYLASLRSKVQEMSSPKGSQNNTKQNDDRYWRPEIDKAGTGSAVIRFLPPKAGNAFPFVRLWSHGYQNQDNNKWFIDNCPSSLGGLPSDVCPVCADNNTLWNVDKLPQKDSPSKQLASSRKRKLSYISNILVVKDPKHPENEGKVFLFKYGKKIFEKIKDQIDPPAEFADMQPIDPYDMEEGANFKLRQVKVDGFPNYDKSSFDAPTAIGDEDFIASIEEQLFDLNALLDPKHFKSYEKLADRFAFVSGESAAPATTSAGGDSTTSQPSLEDGLDDDAPVVMPKKTATAAAKTTGKTAKPKSEAVAEAPDQTQDDDYFEKLAAQSANED